jgi:tetratricopeptide (TPR) repeat protein
VISNSSHAAKLLRLAAQRLLMATKLLPAVSLAASLAYLGAAQAHSSSHGALSPSLAQANAALQAGEADKALALLQSVPQSNDGAAQAANLECRVRLTLEQWETAVSKCQEAVHLDDQDSDYHLWLGRALGEKADRALFLTAYSLAKRTRAEFEESVRLDPRNADALADLGEFYEQAPGVVGGGIDRAEAIAAKLDSVDPARAHVLRAEIAEQQKDYAAAEREYKQAIGASKHPASHWISLAGFYRRRKQWTEMEAAVHSGQTAAERDKAESARAGEALYDGASLLSETHRDPALAAKMFDDYLAGSAKTEEAPAFVAHLRLARLKDQLGDPAAASRERAAALALANEYKPAEGAH